MTPTEIRNLIAKKIAGQGTMVDVGNGLPAILNGLVELVEEATAAAAAAAPKIITSGKSWDEVTAGEYNTKALFASALGIPESDVDDLPSCDELKLSNISIKRTYSAYFGDGVIFLEAVTGTEITGTQYLSTDIYPVLIP